jgi:hypothetical protein
MPSPPSKEKSVLGSKVELVTPSAQHCSIVKV